MSGLPARLRERVLLRLASEGRDEFASSSCPVTNELVWAVRSDYTNECYRASGREGRVYMVLRIDDLEAFEEGGLEWAAGVAVTVSGLDGKRSHRILRKPHQEHSLLAAQRLCQAWEDAFEMADEMLLSGNVELAQRLNTETEN